MTMTTISPLAHQRSATVAEPAATTTDVTTPAAAGTEAVSRSVLAGRWTFSVVRVALGFTFLWAFVDKLVGLDHATPSARSWLNGGSPTTGFLKGVEGPMAGFFNNLAGNRLIDWIFMLGLLGIGVALTLGVGMRIAAASATVMLVLMWMASLPITTNPFLDDHLVYAAVIIGLALTHIGDGFSLARRWTATRLVRRVPVLR